MIFHLMISFCALVNPRRVYGNMMTTEDNAGPIHVQGYNIMIQIHLRIYVVSILSYMHFTI